MRKVANTWVDIEGYHGKYQINHKGEIRRVYKNGKVRLLTPYTSSKGSKNIKATKQKLYIGLTDNTGKKKEHFVHILVAKHFLPAPEEGQVVYHVNGVLDDNWVNNLRYIDRRSLGRITGPSSKRRPVVKIDKTGEIVDHYPSAREAAKNNFMSRQTITDRCNLISCNRSIFAPDGYAYAWDDDEKSLDAVLTRIKEESKHDKQGSSSRTINERPRVRGNPKWNKRDHLYPGGGEKFPQPARGAGS